ncbi:hypothetical protein [Streptomyces sp. NPDC001787]|uniref:hypothetical protein n=1 Tax=Streptomyces sp. NPDC001787 TaxID=3154523 RepID=UPI003332D50C
MHDIRIRGIAERATDHGRLKVTLTQLWYLSRTRNYAWGAREPEGVPAGLRWLVALPVAAALLVCAVLAGGDLAFFAGVAAFLVLVAASVMRHRPGQLPRSQVIPSEETFRRLMTGAWSAAYGSLPRGVFDDAHPLPRPRGTDRARTAAPVARPTSVILCTDPVAALFLTANDLPGRLGAVLLRATAPEAAAEHSAALTDALAQLAGYRTALPLVVLHDADPSGVLLAPLLRAAQPGRVVVDAGLPVSAARGRAGAVRLARPCRSADEEQLRTVAGLSGADAAWLIDGFWSPVAAVPPRLLESVVVRAVERALAAEPPGPRNADTGGFLSWPPVPRPARERGTGRPGSGTSRNERPSSA